MTLIQKIKIPQLLSEATTSVHSNVFTFTLHSCQKNVRAKPGNRLTRQWSSVLHQGRFSFQIPLLIVPLPLAWTENDFLKQPLADDESQFISNVGNHWALIRTKHV